MRIFLIVLMLAAGCGSSSPSGNDGGGGGSSGGDMAGTPASSSCSGARDCRLFSSYCVSAPCRCFAVGAHDVDPPCTAGMQTCIVDPCLNKVADCQNSQCVVSP